MGEANSEKDFALINTCFRIHSFWKNYKDWSIAQCYAFWISISNRSFNSWIGNHWWYRIVAPVGIRVRIDPRYRLLVVKARRLMHGSLEWDQINRRPVSQQVRHDKDASLFKVRKGETKAYLLQPLNGNCDITISEIWILYMLRLILFYF